MARKTKEEAQRTRQLLIESAIQQFALRGVTNTTLTDIADAAGVTRGAVYWHFASKTELFNEMWQQQPPLRDLIQPSQAIEYEQEPLNALRERFIAGLRYIAANPRQRALMQILYQRCEFSSDMLSEYEIRQRIGFNYSSEYHRKIHSLKQCLFINFYNCDKSQYYSDHFFVFACLADCLKISISYIQRRLFVGWQTAF